MNFAKQLKRIEIIEVPQRFYFKISAAAEYSGLSKNTLRKYTDLGHIPAKRLPGGARLYCKEDLDAFVASLPDAVEQFPPVGRHAHELGLAPSDLSETPAKGGKDHGR